MSDIRKYISIVEAAEQPQILEESLLKNAALGFSAFALLVSCISLGVVSGEDSNPQQPSAIAEPSEETSSADLVQKCVAADNAALQGIGTLISRDTAHYAEAQSSLRQAIDTCKPMLSALDSINSDPALSSLKGRATKACYQSLKYKIRLYQDILDGEGNEDGIEQMMKYTAKCNAAADAVS